MKQQACEKRKKHERKWKTLNSCDEDISGLSLGLKNKLAKYQLEIKKTLLEYNLRLKKKLFRDAEEKNDMRNDGEKSNQRTDLWAKMESRKQKYKYTTEYKIGSDNVQRGQEKQRREAADIRLGATRKGQKGCMQSTKVN